MKIDPTATADLLVRMAEAAASDVSNVDATSSTEAVPEAAVADAQLEGRVRATAQRALRGEYASSEAVRADVVEQILRSRWEGQVEAGRLEEMVREVGPSLADDPEFQRQIDQMLLLAAQRVGQQ